MTKTIGRIDREGVVSFGDAYLAVWEESLPSANGTDGLKKRDEWEHAFKRHVFARIVQNLNRLGWKCVVPADYMKRYGARFARDRRECSKGDLKGWLEVSGRSIDFEMWQGVNTPTRPDHGGRYESDKEGCMPYLLRLEMERTRRRIRDYLCSVFTGYSFDSKQRGIYKRPMQFTAMELIEQSYAEIWHFKGDMAEYLKENGYVELPSYNCTSRDGQRIQHGQRVWFQDYDGRIGEGTAYYNINSMWWVVTGLYDRRNIGTCDIWVSCPENPRAKRNELKRRLRLESELSKAVKAMDFKRAEVLKHILYPKPEPIAS